MNRPVYCLVHQHIGVQAKRSRRGAKYFLDDEAEEPIVIVREGTLLVPLDEELVLTPGGEPIIPSGRFFATAETIDPHHLVFDVIDANAAKFIGFP